MKILVLSLLRLGDLFQIVILLETLRSQGHEVHVLVNDSLLGVEALFPDLKLHYFARSKLQALVAYPYVNLLNPIKTLADEIEILNAIGFDEIQNWTHTTISAHLMDLLEAPMKRGIHFENGKIPTDLNKTTIYLNESWALSQNASFHFTDALAMSMQFEFPRIPTALVRRKGPIVLQVLTSDYRKNWNPQKWVALATILRQLGHEVRVLCAPYEHASLLRQGFLNEDIDSLELVCLPEYLRKARLVIAGDTSILHLAAKLETPVLGLYLGPANPKKTAPRQLGGRVLWVDIACSPCRHRDPCVHLKHECESNLSVQQVINEVMGMINNEAVERYGEAIGLVGSQGQLGAYVLHPDSDDPMVEWSQLVWEFYLNRDHDVAVAPYGSAARLLLQRWGAKKSISSWIEMLQGRLKASFDLIDKISENIWSSMRSFNEIGEVDKAGSERQLRDLANQLHLIWSETDFVTRLITAASDATPSNAFIRLRLRKEALQEVFQLLSVQKNIAKVIELELREGGEVHGARA